jgi:hypothetical protein
MTGRFRARLSVALVLGVIWLAALAAPASAAVTTIRYVDDNPNATSCHGTRFHTIQAAINASNEADIVYVCPGTYREQLVLDVPWLTVQSLRHQRATLKPPASLGSPALVEMAAKGTKLRGFNIEIPAGSAGPRATGGPVCENLEVAIVVLAPRVGVWGNWIDSIGDATLSGACGYDIGILVVGDLGPLPATFTQLASNKTAIKRNYIRDFKLAGILVEGEASVRILLNRIRYVHQDDPATCVPVNTLTATPDLTFPCEQVENVIYKGSNGSFSLSMGIGVAGGAHVDAAFNTVFSTFDIALVELEEEIPLAGGIIFFDAAPGSRITENVVTQVFIGIAVGAQIIPLANPTGITPSSGNVDVTFNRANEGYAGIVIDGDDNYIYANRARLNLLGLGIFEGSDNYFFQNDARYNFGIDCYDDTTGTGTEGTANTWEDNLGNFNEPQEICMDTGDPF